MLEMKMTLVNVMYRLMTLIVDSDDMTKNRKYPQHT